MEAALSPAVVLVLAGILGLTELGGLGLARVVSTDRRVVCWATGGLVGVMAGTLAFELLPSLFARPGGHLALVVAGMTGFACSALLRAVLTWPLPHRHEVLDDEVASFVLAATVDDIAEGVLLGLSGLVSAHLVAVAFGATLAKNALEGFSEGTVLRWEGRSAAQALGAGVLAAGAVVVATGLALVAAHLAGWGPGAARVAVAGAAGALVHASVVDAAASLEGNADQWVGGVAAFGGTGVVAWATGGSA